MKAGIRRLVRRRARGRCEYCCLPERFAAVSIFHVEHIRPRCHGGSDHPSNLALACHFCNWHKGTNLTGFDALSGRIVKLFHPRQHRRATHFRFDAATLIGRTAIGRTTISVLMMNHPDALRVRQHLIDEGVWKPLDL